MIQRKQTLYILAAIILSMVLLVRPIGSFEVDRMGESAILFSLGIVGVGGKLNFNTSIILFVITLITSIIGIFSIFQYNKRKLQMRLCTINICLLLIWYASYFYFGYCAELHKGIFKPAFVSCFPLIVIVLYFMAFRGIQADENLIRSTDRIR